MKTYEPETKATPRTTAKALSSSRSLRREQAAPGGAQHGQAPPTRLVERAPSARARARGSVRAARRRRGRRRGRPPGRSSCAAPGSWLTMTTVWPWVSTTRRRKPSTSAPDVESRLPVGSSAKTIVGPAHQRPGARHPLLLATGQLARPVAEPVAQPHGVDDLVEPRRVGRRPAMADGSRMFSCAVRVGTRLKAWKTNPIRSRRSSVRCFSLRVVEVDAPDPDVPRGRVVEPGGAVHQGRLARAGLAHDRGELTGIQVEGDVVEGDDPGLTGAVDLAQALDPGGGQALTGWLAGALASVMGVLRCGPGCGRGGRAGARTCRDRLLPHQR